MRVIHYEDWRLWADPGPAIARQYDNLTRRLEITGDLPEGWDWTLLVQADREHLDLIALRPMEGGLGVDLTAEMLALSGYYTIQLRGNQGELARHTNQVRIFIPSSLSGDANWPEVPSEFSQAEADIRALNAHPPIPGDGGYWLVWDLDGEKYVTSSLPLPDVSVGPPGQAATITVGETVTGEPGTQAAVENTGTENAAVLRFTIPRGAAGPTGATPDISVEVTGLPAGSEPTAEVSGTPEQPVIALGIPAGRQGEPGGKGDPGTPGKDGSPGQTPSITVGQVETLPAGSPVTASITGQTPNLVLNLGIPQGQQGASGQAATVEIAETETVASDTPAAMVELPDSTPQARRYKAQVPQGVQGPAGLGVPPISGPEDAGKAVVVNGDGTQFVLGEAVGGGGEDWAYHDLVSLTEEVVEVSITPDKPLKKLMLLICAQQTYADSAEAEPPDRRTNQTIRLNGISENMFYNLFEAGSYSSFVKSRAVISIIQGNLVGTYEYLPGSASGGYQITGIDSKSSVNFPMRENINKITVCSNYNFITGVGNVGRFAVGSTFEIWGVYA